MTTLLRPKAPPINIDQYLAFRSPPGFRDELIEGEIVVSPEPKPLHHDVALNIFRLLETAAGQAFKVGMRINMRMPQDNSMPSPGVFVMDRLRWRAALQRDSYPDSSPLLAVEVISPGNRKARIDQKVALYLKNGSVSVWVVYPRKQIIKAHRLGQSPLVVLAGGFILLPAPLPAVPLSLSEMFVQE